MPITFAGEVKDFDAARYIDASLRPKRMARHTQFAVIAAREALAAGHRMLVEFGALADRWRKDFAIDTGIGVGLHLGEVALGILGPPGQKAPTLVGDTVNVAARLCSRARAGEVLLSCTVAAALAIDNGPRELNVGLIPVLQLPQFALRGRSAPLDIWCVPAQERLVF